ncbi:MAG: DoxX family protein [Isosphaera sp.]|nr:DoxX family protein [Isosphaera sp.]
MFWAVLMARVLLGGMFLLAGVNALLPTPFFDIPPPPTDAAKAHLKLLAVDSHYLKAVKVLEVAGGLLVLSGRLVPLGLVILAPIAVNVLFHEIFLVGQAGPGLALVVLCVALIWAYRSHFAGLFAFKPRIG